MFILTDCNLTSNSLNKIDNKSEEQLMQIEQNKKELLNKKSTLMYYFPNSLI